MHLLAQRVVAEARRRGATIDPVEHFDLLVDLDKAARESADLAPDDLAVLLDTPVIINGITLRRLSFGGAWWLTECAIKWWRSNAWLMDLATVWVMANGRSRQAIDGAVSESVARDTVIRFGMENDASMEALISASLQMQPAGGSVLDAQKHQAKQKPESVVPRYGFMYGILLKHRGQTLDYWLFETSLDLVTSTLDSIIESGELSTTDRMGFQSSNQMKFNKWVMRKSAFFRILGVEVKKK